MVRFLRKFYTEKTLAAMLDTSPSTLSRCSRGKQPLQPSLLLRVYELLKRLPSEEHLKLARLKRAIYDNDLLCTLAIAAIIELARSNVGFEAILTFQDSTMVTAYIISKYLGASMSVILTAPTTIPATLQCIPIRVGEGLVLPACLTPPTRRGLRRLEAILLMPLSMSGQTVASQVAEELSYLYRIAAVILPICDNGEEQLKRPRSVCIFRKR